jgi:MFS family permease
VHGDPARLFLWSGLLWHAAVRAYWVSLVVRMTVDLQLSSLELVLVGTAMELALLLAEVPTGVVADTVSRKWSVVVGFAVVGSAQMGAGLVESFPSLVISQILWGIGYTFRSGADTAWITDELGSAAAVESLVLRRARLQMVVSVAAIAGGAGLARLTSLSTSVVLAGGTLLVTGSALGLLMGETGFQPRRAAEGQLCSSATSPSSPLSLGVFRATMVDGARAILSNRSLRILLAALMLSGLASEAVDRLDIRRLDQLGLSARYDEILVVGVIAASEAALGALLLWWTESRLTGSQVVPGLALLLALSAVGIATLGLVAVLPLASLGLVVQGGVRSAAAPLQLTWANAQAPSEVRATVLSFVEQANSIGEISGGVVLGTVAAVTTVPTALACSVVLILAAALTAVRATATWAPPARTV